MQQRKPCSNFLCPITSLLSLVFCFAPFIYLHTCSRPKVSRKTRSGRASLKAQAHLYISAHESTPIVIFFFFSSFFLFFLTSRLDLFFFLLFFFLEFSLILFPMLHITRFHMVENGQHSEPSLLAFKDLYKFVQAPFRRCIIFKQNDNCYS